MNATCAPSASAIPAIRVRNANGHPLRPDRDVVLYWMTAFRRTRYNFALQRAVEWASELRRPLVVFEPLRVDYRWASDRFHSFVIDGMADNEAACGAAGIAYYPYIEPAAGAGKGLLRALAARSCIVVTDDYPAFFLPAAGRAAAVQVDVAMEAVDSNGLHPLRAPGRAFDTAFAFRRWHQHNTLENLIAMPEAEPLGSAPHLAAALPRDILDRWPMGRPRPDALAALLIDHGVARGSTPGGSTAAVDRLSQFIRRQLPRYVQESRHPDLDAVSGLSPFLHFGQTSVHEILDAVARSEGWSPDRMRPESRGGRTGFWGMSASSEAFLDQLVTWRELGFNFCAHREDYDRYESLPAWARNTLERHERDPRPHLYSVERLERAETPDALWNAAQMQLVSEGVIQNYIRMLWGKRIIEWTASPRDAIDVMIHLNNKYALDGRDPNSYSGIFWTLGRYDRPWGPERPIFGTVRYMSSANTMRKLKLRRYLARYGPRAAT